MQNVIQNIIKYFTYYNKKDDILQECRFTNVRIEEMKGTIYESSIDIKTSELKKIKKNVLKNIIVRVLQIDKSYFKSEGDFDKIKKLGDSLDNVLDSFAFIDDENLDAIYYCFDNIIEQKKNMSCDPVFFQIIKNLKKSNNFLIYQYQ